MNDSKLYYILVRYLEFYFSIEKVEIAHNALFANHGQNCCAGSRTLVQAGIHDEFVKRAAAMAKARRVGDPWEEGVEQGPQIDGVQRDKILGFIEAGKREGATLEAGGAGEGEIGFFIQPTVFSGKKNVFFLKNSFLRSGRPHEHRQGGDLWPGPEHPEVHRPGGGEPWMQLHTFGLSA